MPLHLLLLLSLGTGSLSYQTASAQPALAPLIRDLPAAARVNDMAPMLKLAEILADAPLHEVEANLPSLIALTESSNDRTRSFAMLSLTGLEGIKENSSRPIDIERLRLLLPYTTRLAPRLFDPATPGVTAILLNPLASSHPQPPEILPLLFHALDDPRSTKPLPSPQNQPDGSSASDIYVGPGIVAILLNAGATFYRDPATDITEGSDSAEVQQAILRFLHRSDQTDRSVAQTIHAIAHAQPQNPELNADLLRFLDSNDPMVRMEMLRSLPSLTFAPADFAEAKAHVISMASDPAAAVEFRTTANTILPCWDNNRHHACQYIQNSVSVR